MKLQIEYTIKLRNVIVENDLLQAALLIPKINNINYVFATGDNDEMYTDTPLTIALAAEARYGIAHMLLDNGADANVCCPMFSLVKFGSSLNDVRELAEKLLSKGANLNLVDYDDYRGAPLHQAVSDEQIDFVEFFLERGAKPNLEDNMGNTPLRYAKSPEIAVMLVAAGADLMYRNRDGYTLYDLYREGYASGKVMTHLIEQGLFAPPPIEPFVWAPPYEPKF